MSSPNEWLRTGADRKNRCWWCGDDALYMQYHDTEWGRPVTDDTRLYEKLCLEGFQSGLSWLTILRKRENFRAAFRGFDIESVAAFGVGDVTRLLQDAGIVRHRGKIEATINNAQRAVELIESEGSISGFVWSYASDAAFGRDGTPAHSSGLATTSPGAIALSKELKKRGWKFVGPTTVYSFMQSMGLVNDHLDGCLAQKECDTARRAVLKKR